MKLSMISFKDRGNKRASSIYLNGSQKDNLQSKNKCQKYYTANWMKTKPYKNAGPKQHKTISYLVKNYLGNFCKISKNMECMYIYIYPNQPIIPNNTTKMKFNLMFIHSSLYSLANLKRDICKSLPVTNSLTSKIFLYTWPSSLCSLVSNCAFIIRSSIHYMAMVTQPKLNGNRSKLFSIFPAIMCKYTEKGLLYGT